MEHHRTADKPYVPQQREGKQVDLEAGVEFSDSDAAVDFFGLVRDRLFDINRWNEIAAIPVAMFVLTDTYGGEPIDAPARVGSFVRIDIPGPGTATGKGYDWVMVADMEDMPYQYAAITLRPAIDPAQPGKGTGHFFTSSASSTLIAELDGIQVRVRYHGRNEVINTDTDSTLDNIRNALVGGSAKLGLSYPQWQGLLDGLLAPEINRKDN